MALSLGSMSARSALKSGMGIERMLRRDSTRVAPGRGFAQQDFGQDDAEREEVGAAVGDGVAGALGGQILILARITLPSSLYIRSRAFAMPNP